jgi:hypothetical protein
MPAKPSSDTARNPFTNLDMARSFIEAIEVQGFTDRLWHRAMPL